MKPIVTLTLNPTIDGASEAEVVRPTRKVRTSNERYDPGGGGINVARVLAELGRSALPVYLEGGATGSVLNDLLVTRAFRPLRVAIQGHTRISQTVFERSTGLEYRLVPEGPLVTHDECQNLVNVIADLDFEWLVASGSLPRGAPADFYSEIAQIARGKKGPALSWTRLLRNPIVAVACCARAGATNGPASAPTRVLRKSRRFMPRA